LEPLIGPAACLAQSAADPRQASLSAPVWRDPKLGLAPKVEDVQGLKGNFFNPVGGTMQPLRAPLQAVNPDAFKLDPGLRVPPQATNPEAFRLLERENGNFGIVSGPSSALESSGPLREPCQPAANFSIVCGPSLSPESSVKKISELSDIDSVSRRMGDLLGLCRSKLMTSRRSAFTAEERLHEVEQDLDRMGHDWRELESSLEVARRLFDSQNETPESDDPGHAQDGAYEKAKQAWRILAGTMSKAGASERLPEGTGPERASALLHEALNGSQNRALPTEPHQPPRGAPFLELLEEGARHGGDTNQIDITFYADRECEEVAAQQDVFRQDESRFLREPSGPPRGTTASDLLYLATVPPPEPRARRQQFFSSGRKSRLSSRH
jgi:hypothetical protein